MFIKNDASPEKRYFNGKIGKVISLSDTEVVVKCPDDNFKIITKPEIWENIKYGVDDETKVITEDKIGSYTQIPLRLAWSITIHKSQGLTFEKAIIDVESSFAHGQTYVALSRCKSIDGLVLTSRVTPSQIIRDNNVTAFNENAEANQPNDKILKASKRVYQLDLIKEVFDFYNFLFPTNRILDINYKNKNSIEGNIEEPLQIIKNTVATLLKISTSFNSQLQILVGDYEIPETNNTLQERFTKGITYFTEQIRIKIESSLKSFEFITDNKALEKDINKQLNSLETQLSTKLSFFEGLKKGFNVQQFLELRSNAVFEEQENSKNLRKAVIKDTANLELFELLRTLRNDLAKRHELAHFQIFTQKSLYAMCEMLPTTKQALKEIYGMGKTRIENYGDEVVSVINHYCDETNLQPSNKTAIIEDVIIKPKRQIGETKKISLELYKKGRSLQDIADERELNINTIFGHLASFIPSGEIEVKDVMSISHYKELKKIIPTKIFENLSDLKHQLNDKYSYGELRLVINELSKN